MSDSSIGIIGRLAALSAAAIWLAACASQPAPQPLGPGTPDFLDASDFDGKYRVNTRHTILGGESIYVGRMVFTNLDQATVATVLPSDLKLATNISTSNPDEHPVLLLFGNQTNTAWVLPGGSPSFGPNYQELILLIPFVQKVGKTRWHNYVVRMYLNDFAAMLLGNQFYGYRKIMATFGVTATDFNAFLNCLHVFESQASSPGTWMPNANALTTLNNYADALEIMSMPILGTLELVPTKPYRCSYFDWDMTDAEVRTISNTHTFLQPFVSPQMDPWVAKGALTSVTDGAFEIRDVEWRIAFPPGSFCKF